MKHRLLCLAAAACAVLAALAAGVPAGEAATPEPQLLARYQPVTQFDPLERFLPTKVQSFVSDADLEQLVGANWTLVDTDPEPGKLPTSGTWRLNQDSCSPSALLGGLDCYASASAKGSGGPAVYGRVAHEDGRIVLQYWYFYYEDVYSYEYPPSNFIWQAHEGDWEVVNVVLSEDEQPLFVGYSQHCLGQRRDWIDTLRFDETHPIVHVALGSHANYFSAGEHPIALACVPPAARAVLTQLILPPPSDFAFPGETTGPAAVAGPVTTIHRIEDDHPAWMSFPGFWGEVQYFHGPGPIGPIPFGTSPQGPEFHSAWTDPLGTLATWPEG
jgi:hypothetical protein